MLSTLNQLIRGISSLLIVVMTGIAGWLGYEHFYAPDPVMEAKDRALAEKDQLLEKKTDQINDLTKRTQQMDAEITTLNNEVDRLEMAVRLLKVDRRVAQIDVIEQSRDPETERLVTNFHFVELSNDGKPLHAPFELTIEGDLVYVDYWVVKFEDELISTGDPLRSTSICLFRRIFGEHQQPSEGFELDTIGSQPLAYGRGEQLTEFEKEIWDNFWQHAVNSRTARDAGVRAAHGEAPSIRLFEGKRYKIVLRASGGLSFQVEDAPPSADNAL